MQFNQMRWMWQMQQASGSATSFCKTPDGAHENMLLTQHTKQVIQQPSKCTFTHTISLKRQVNTRTGAQTLTDDVEIVMKTCER